MIARLGGSCGVRVLVSYLAVCLHNRSGARNHYGRAEARP
jgi:hypothetical protein